MIENIYYRETPDFVYNRVDALLGHFVLSIARERKEELLLGHEYYPEDDEADRLARRIIRAYNRNEPVTLPVIFRFLELSGNGLDVEITFSAQETCVCFIDDDLIED